MKSWVGTDAIASFSRAFSAMSKPPCRCRHPRSIVNNRTTNGGSSMTALSPILKQATPVVVDHAQGCEVFDTDGRRHLDFTAGIGVVSTGHCHPKVVAAAQEQVGKLIHG